MATAAVCNGRPPVIRTVGEQLGRLAGVAPVSGGYQSLDGNGVNCLGSW